MTLILLFFTVGGNTECLNSRQRRVLCHNNNNSSWCLWYSCSSDHWHNQTVHCWWRPRIAARCWLDVEKTTMVSWRSFALCLCVDLGRFRRRPSALPRSIRKTYWYSTRQLQPLSHTRQLLQPAVVTNVPLYRRPRLPGYLIYACDNASDQL